MWLKEVSNFIPFWCVNCSDPLKIKQIDTIYSYFPVVYEYNSATGNKTGQVFAAPHVYLDDFIEGPNHVYLTYEDGRVVYKVIILYN